MTLYQVLLVYHHHHHDVRLARISLTFSLHVSLSFIAFGRSSGLHPVSSHSCCMNVRAGRPAFDWPYAGVHRCTSLTISSLLLQQCPACLVRLACIVLRLCRYCCMDAQLGCWLNGWRRSSTAIIQECCEQYWTGPGSNTLLVYKWTIWQEQVLYIDRK